MPRGNIPVRGSRLLRDKLQAGLDNGSGRYLNNIVSFPDRMIRLIDHLLSFSRLSNTGLNFEPADLGELLKRIIYDLEILLTETGASIDINILPVAKYISFQLGQVFQNLIANSLKFAHFERKPVIGIGRDKPDGKNGRSCNWSYAHYFACFSRKPAMVACLPA